jgi:glycosyltransferase involved in cell wall biosynthesis
VVYRRFNKVNVGKGYALDYSLKHSAGLCRQALDAYMVFDADNILDRNYIRG